LIRAVPLLVWLLLLVLITAFFAVPKLSTSGSNRPQMLALEWAFAAIAVRAMVALVRRQRTWWSLAYLVLFVVLPFIADRVRDLWLSSHLR
jgi:hypothetical protein